MQTEPLSAMGRVHYTEFISGLIHPLLSLEKITVTERTCCVVADKRNVR